MFDLPAPATTGKEYCEGVIGGALLCEVFTIPVPATEALERLGSLHTLHSLTDFESAHFTWVLLKFPLQPRERCRHHVPGKSDDVEAIIVYESVRPGRLEQICRHKYYAIIKYLMEKCYLFASEH